MDNPTPPTPVPSITTAAPTATVLPPSSVVNSPRKPNKKMIVGLIVLLFVTAGTISGVLLLRQQQLINQKASGITGLQCNQIKAYDSNWTELSSSDLSKLKTGDVIRFAAVGTGLGAQYKAARFKINGTQLPDTSLKTPNGDYYYSYSIPANVTTFSITAQVESAVDNTWY